jgi:hypothetical protein
MTRYSTVDSALPLPTIGYLFPEDNESQPVALTRPVSQMRLQLSATEYESSTAFETLSSLSLADLDPPKKPASAADANRVLANMFGKESSPEDDESTVTKLNAQTVAEMSGSMLMAAVGIFMMKSLNSLALKKFEGQEILTEMECQAEIKRASELAEQYRLAAIEALKQHQAAIINNVMSWLIATADLFTGIAAALSGNVAAATTAFGAATAGFVKAGAEVHLLQNPNDPQAQKMASDAAHVQMGFQVANALVGGFSVGRMIGTLYQTVGRQVITMVANYAGKDLLKAMASGALKDVMQEAITATAQRVAASAVKNSDDALKALAPSVAKTAGRTAAESLVNNLREIATRSIKELTSPENMQKLLQECIENACKNNIKNASTMTAKELSKEVRWELGKRLAKETLLANRTISTEVRLLLQPMQVGTRFGLKTETDELKKQIETLQAMQQMIMSMMAFFENQREKNAEEMKNVNDKHVDVTRRAVEGIQQHTQMMDTISVKI